METKRWIVPDPIERLPAVLLAVIVTGLVFAALNAGFAPQAMAVAGWQQAALASAELGA